MEQRLGELPEGAWSAHFVPTEESEESEVIAALADEADTDDEIIETLPDEDESNVIALHPNATFRYAGSSEIQEAADATQVKNVEAESFTRDRIAQEIALMKIKLSQGVDIHDMRAMLENDRENTDDLIAELDDDQQEILKEEIARRETIVAKLKYLEAIDAVDAAAAK